MRGVPVDKILRLRRGRWNLCNMPSRDRAEHSWNGLRFLQSGIRWD